ncbi:MAG: VOC family protein [Gemmatimonadota bacterium]|nr:VOC family protein [Gemmatimonadota bacterium]
MSQNAGDPSKSRSTLQPFHLAIAVNDLAQSREFYGEFLGFDEGRSNEKWIDWNFFGHQLVTHLRATPVDNKASQIVNEVDDHGVVVPHFGVVLGWQDWHNFAEKLKQHNVKFIIEPYIRFRGEIGEQATMFFYDPSGNALEFKAFKDISQLSKKYKK